MKNLHTYKTCVVMGNGKSLLTMPDLPYPKFGVNYITTQPDRYVCIDKTVLEQHPDKIYNTAKNAKIAYLSGLCNRTEENESLYNLSNVVVVNKDNKAFADEMYMSGFTCTYVALKMAYYEGFERVLVYGVDLSDGWEHYRDDYPRPRTELDDFRKMIMLWHFHYADQIFRADGKKIINYSYPSDLDAFMERGML